MCVAVCASLLLLLLLTSRGVGVGVQTCMDPACRAIGFRSNAVPLPRHVLAALPPTQLAVLVEPVRKALGSGVATRPPPP